MKIDLTNTWVIFGLAMIFIAFIRAKTNKYIKKQKEERKRNGGQISHLRLRKAISYIFFALAFLLTALPTVMLIKIKLLNE